MTSIRTFCTVGLLAFGLAVNGAPKSSELSLAFTALSGTQASFVQRFRPRGFQKDQIEKGSVIFGASPQMRWTYSQPEPKTFVFDGTTSWLYVPAEKQVTVDRVTEAEKRELPFLLLGDGKTIDKQYTVKETRRTNAITVELLSRSNTQMVRSITLTTSPRDHSLRRLEYSDRQGNRTAFEFSAHRRVPPVASGFVFTPPAGVRIIQND